MGMSNIYLVNWSDGGIDDALELVNDTAYGAYIQFLDANISRSVSVTVWTKGAGAESDGGLLEKFDEHLYKSPENSQPRKQEVSLTDQTQQESLLSHRDNLRRATAYPILRVINLLNSVAIVFLFLFWGNEVGREEGLIIFGIFGIIVAILSYSFTSVFFDVADSSINTSRNS